MCIAWRHNSFTFSLRRFADFYIKTEFVVKMVRTKNTIRLRRTKWPAPVLTPVRRVKALKPVSLPDIQLRSYGSGVHSGLPVGPDGVPASAHAVQARWEGDDTCQAHACNSLAQRTAYGVTGWTGMYCPYHARKLLNGGCVTTPIGKACCCRSCQHVAHSRSLNGVGVCKQCVAPHGDLSLDRFVQYARISIPVRRKSKPSSTKCCDALECPNRVRTPIEDEVANRFSFCSLHANRLDMQLLVHTPVCIAYKCSECGQLAYSDANDQHTKCSTCVPASTAPTSESEE